MIRIVTDSTAYITKEYAYKNALDIVPLLVSFEGESMQEGFPGEYENFFNRLGNSKDFPVTSQPSAGSFAKVFEEAVEKDNEVIVITISSKLSGTYNSACIARDIVDNNRISVIDSLTSASNLRMLVERALDLSNKGMSRQEIVDIINMEKSKMGIRLTVNTLDYLKKGGRLTGAQALVGSILNIKPIIALVDGSLIPSGKVRGKFKAVETMISEIPKDVEQISICHVLSPDEAEEFRTMLQDKFINVKITVDELGPVIGAHLGPGAIGVCYKW